MTDTTTLDPRSALDTAIDAARLANPTIKFEDERSFVFVPEGYDLKETTHGDLLDNHIKQKPLLHDRTSLCTYVNRFKDERSVLFADYDASTISAHLDYHHSNEFDREGLSESAPSHNNHVSTLRIRQSEEFARWAGMEGKMHSQAEFALFIEENVTDIITPEHGEMIEICRDLEATQGSSFKSRTRLENGDLSFKYETETRVTSDVVVPSEIALLIPLYYGEDPTEIRAKFRFRVSEGGLLLGFNWHRVEYERQAKFHEMAYDAAETTGLPVFFGRP